MYYARKWELISGMLTIVLATFAVVVPPPGSGWWWRLTVIVIALASIIALWRGIMLQPIPRPHPLRLKVEKFVCDLSEERDSGLVERAIEINHGFWREGLYHSHFPKEDHLTHQDLNQAAVCFQALLGRLPY